MPPQNQDELVISIPGSTTLKDIKSVIRFHEGFLWKFKSNAVDGKMNKVSLVASDDVPLDFDFAPESAPKPAGKEEVWRGKLRYNWAEQTVVVYH